MSYWTRICIRRRRNIGNKFHLFPLGFFAKVPFVNPRQKFDPPLYLKS